MSSRPLIRCPSSEFSRRASLKPTRSIAKRRSSHGEGVSEFLCVRRVQSHPPLGKRLYLTNDRAGKAMMLAASCSLVRSKHLFFRPDLPFHRQACVNPVKFAACGGTGATRSPAWGEHGEDPQFDRVEHAATLAARQGLTLRGREQCRQASRVNRSP